MRLATLTLAVATGVVAPCLQAQDGKDNQETQRNKVWQIDGLRTGFCVQFLLDPAQLDVPVSRSARLLRADAIENLSPVLRNVISTQPEYGAWTPSSVCLYYMQSVDVGSLRVSERDPRKAPMIGVWSLAAVDADGGARRDLVMRLFTNTDRLERAGQLNGLDLRTIRSKVYPVLHDEDPTAPPLGTSYEIKLGKTLLIWEGRRVSDSTRANGAVASDWRADSRRKGPMTARLVLNPQWTQAMVGSLRVEGKDAFAKAVKASPIRFVGPAMLGGAGELAFGR
jgi:hypothetical protein